MTKPISKLGSRPPEVTKALEALESEVATALESQCMFLEVQEAQYGYGDPMHTRRVDTLHEEIIRLSKALECAI